MKLYRKFVVVSYLKNFFIVFLALQSFYTAVEVIPNIKHIADSANLKILFMLFKFLNAINYTLPLSIIFALIISKFQIIRTNELLAIYASGVSKQDVIKPIFVSSLIITLIFIVLNNTQFVYSNNYAQNIKEFNTIQKSQKDLFLKHYSTYVYFEKFDKIKKEATNIQVYITNNNMLREIIKAKKAIFKDDYWEITNAKITKIVGIKSSSRLIHSTKKSIKLLKDFKPQIIKSLYTQDDKSAITITDALGAMKLFSNQSVDTTKIRANLYKMLFFPLFAPFFIVILFYKLPISMRFFNAAYVSSIFIITSLLSWGVLFLLTRISMNLVILPEIGILLPIVLLATYSYYLHRVKN